MSAGDAFVNYALCRDLVEAHAAGVFPEMGIEGEDEDRHVSELERRMKALDEKEVYIAVKTFIENHMRTVVRSLEYMQKKEGE